MKQLTLLASFLLYTILANAQDGNISRHHFQIGMNMTSFASQTMHFTHPNYDYYKNTHGPGLNLEYNYSLNDYLTIASRVGFSQSFKANSSEYFSNDGNPVTKELSSENKMLYSNLSLRLCPLPERLSWFKIELGAIYSNIIGDFSSNLIYSDRNEANEFSIRDDNFGLLGAIDIVTIKKLNYNIGLRTEIISSYIINLNKKERFDGNAWLFGIYVGF